MPQQSHENIRSQATTTPSTARSYRPELDGLRAIAVLAVFLYHVDISWIPGGFTGVDVFFVLSGYLITGLIVGDLDAGKFSWGRFYTKRVRRLLPALLLMTTATALVGSLLLSPSALVSLAKSIVVQPFALQNVHFLLDGEYFNHAEYKVLLHTWSLGVEEQFYLLWPVFLLVAHRYRKRGFIVVIGAVAGLSFALNLVAITISPKIAFFLLPTRAWELALGGVLSLVIPRAEGLARRNGLLNIAGCVGIALLLVSFGLAYDSSQFPGWLALFPVLGTAILLVGIQSTQGVAYHLLALPPLPAIGRLSYAIYLWHWPVIVFARYSNIEVHQPVAIVCIFAITFALSWLSLRSIEHPIRHGQWLPTTRALLLAVAGAAAMLVGASVVIQRTDGLAFRYTGTARAMLTADFDAAGDDRCGAMYRLVHPNSAFCPLGDEKAAPTRRILLWGNSHAAMWVGTAQSLAAENNGQAYLSTRNCRPTTDNHFCNAAYQTALLRQAEDQDITDVILIGHWHGAYGVPDETFEPQLEDVVHALSSRGIRSWLMVDIPVHDELSPSRRYNENPTNPTFGAMPFGEHERVRARTLTFFEDLRSRYDLVEILDPTNAFCTPEMGCLGGKDDVSWYRDDSHLTRAGANQAASMLRPVFVNP